MSIQEARNPFPYVGRIVINGQTVGTGFAIHNSGYICTCAHVLMLQNNEVSFELINASYKEQAKIVKMDEAIDLAILKVPHLQVYSPSFNASYNITLPTFNTGLDAPEGTPLFLTGYGRTPGLSNFTYFSAAGNVVGQTEKISSTDSSISTRLLQISTTSVLPGMSGAPIISSEGSVFGVLSERFAKTTELAGQAIAIPIEYVTKLINDILTFKPWSHANSSPIVTETIVKERIDGIEFRAGIETLETAVKLQDQELQHRFAQLKERIDNAGFKAYENKEIIEILNQITTVCLGMDFHLLTRSTLRGGQRDKKYFIFDEELVPIPKGSFQIGMNGGIRDSSPSSPVDVEAFLMMKYPVTNYQYWLFTQATGWPPPPHWGGQEPPKKIWTHPVVAVSWGEAIFFCSWLWLVTPWKWRLPTEAEWEYAARGTDGRHFPWGNTFDKSRANTLEGGKNKISDVNAFGSRNESPFGVRDMVGNVWEWTSSLFESYPYTPKTTIEIPTIPSAIFTMSWWDPNETKITMRGGSWGLDKSYSTTYARIWSSAGNRGMYGGFRLVVTGSRRPVVGGFFNNFELNPYADTAAAAMFGAEGWWSKSIEYAGSCGGGVIPAPHPAQKRWKIF